MIVDVASLKKEQLSEERVWDELRTDLGKIIIQDLFSNELSNENYRKYSLEELKEIILTDLGKVRSTNIHFIKVQNLKHKITKAKSAEDALMSMNDYLFLGDGS